MKKFVFILITSLITINLSNAQIAFHDAEELKKYLRPSGPGAFKFGPISGDTDGYIKILKKYVDLAQRPNIKNSRDLHNYFNSKGNSFIANYLNSGGSFSAAGDPPVTTAAFNSISKIGSLNVTNIADGIAKFLVKRTKEELTVAFFDRFKEVFDSYPEFQLLFENTHRNFKIIESFEFNRYLKTLRVDFFKDIDNLHINIAKLNSVTCQPNDNNCTTRVQFYNSFFQSDNGHLLKTGLTIVQELKEGTNPAEFISLIASNTDFNNLTDPAFTNAKNIVKLTNLISNSLRSTDDNETWISGNDLNKLINDLDAFNIYLGLLYQQNDSNTISFQTSSGAKTFRDILGGLANATAPIEAYMKEVAYDIDKIHAALDNIKNIKNSLNQPDNSDYYIFYNSIISLVTDISELNSVLNPLGITIRQKPEIQKFLKLANSAGNVYQDLSSKNYSAVIMDIRILFEDLGVSNDTKFYGEFLKYGSFMAAIVEAEDSDEVSEIIESIALPSGSSTIKKRSKFNLALNAYVGLSPALEYNGDTKDTKFSLGINAPIGVAASWGIKGKNNKEQGSFSVFVPLIDIGAVTNFRFSDDMTEELPEIKLENIFAPGFYVVHGWAKLPISWGIGGQLGPHLREVNTMGNTFDSDPSFSLRAFIAVDIPLLNFYTKSR